jgi:hypothetical protein
MKEEEFRNPGKQYRPSPFWSWNDLLDPEELKRQVREFADKGFGGYFMHSRVGLVTPYLSEEWMRCIAACLEQGKISGTESWLYDEDKWPSGFAGGKVPAKGDEYRARSLVAEEIGEEAVEGVLADPMTVAVFAISFSRPGFMESYRRVGEGFSMKKGERLFSFRVRIHGRSNWYNGETYVDLLNPKVVEEFLKVTIDAYAERFKDDFGEFMPGVFTDEPNYSAGGSALPWTGEMPDYFKELNGYDIVEKLPLLYFEGDGCEKVRYDFWRTATLRFVEAFSKPYGERCGKLGLMLTGHYLAEDNLISQIHVIGAAMPHYEYMQCPGIDHLGRNINDPLTLKQCSSVAHQFGRKRVLCEIFGVSGHSMTFEDQKWIADFHFALGITFLCQHLTLYTMKGDGKRDYPPTISYHQPYWQYYKLMNDYFARAGYLCSQGDFKADILFLHPMGSAWATYAPRLEGERNQRVFLYNRELTSLLEDLLAIHRDFDFGDEIILERHGRVEGNEIRVSECGRYKVALVPPSFTWSRKTYELLSDLSSNGGKVLFVGERPTHIDGIPAEEDWERLVSRENVVVVEHNRKEIERALDMLIPRDISIEDESGEQIGDIYVHHRVDGPVHIYFMSNKSRSEAYKAKVRIPEKGEVTEWDMITGEIYDLPCMEDETGIVLELHFPPVGSHAVVVDTSKPPKPLERGRYEEVSSIVLGREWDFERTHPNSLTLDFCRYRIDGGEWSQVVPIWKARHQIWNASGLSPYSGMQPWAIREKGVKPTPIHVEMETWFESEVDGKRVYLVMEVPEKWSISVNGEKAEKRDGWHWDRQFGKLDISELVRKGRNTIAISCNYDLDVHIEDMYLVGDFGVRRLSGTKYILTDEPKKLLDGNWGDQGYPFYAGNIRYKTKVDLSKSSGDKFAIRLKDPRGTLFVIEVNGNRIPLFCQPWEVDATEFIRNGENEITIEVVGSLRNTFGPLHHRLGDNLPWTGPGEFVDERNWIDEYQLVPYGLIGGAELIIYKAV